MKYRSNRARALALACVAAAAGALTSGCATKSAPPLYGWAGYQPQVYDYLQGKSSPQTQIDALEKSLQQIRGKGERPPPGFHAHLGALYASVGKGQQAQQELLAEKEAFPESSAYMDFLLKNLTK
ncbi:hypothetical protein B0G62_114143 [Paraburkholderia eburnea]|uniref:DUF4810 domain-containing protein n=1 Tax=Paraburkholderia eburnea TaxID=1189126 RepID=A0A2S4M1F8_9BURK|nr:DUF4810 domain-containing protein [Paraburkholderia eburnea]POR48556.1 hypothetical protein B0G62_114143 [Paraburkholderia eburnea]PRZ22434.1 hypothetical protein BX588_107279 [Paraburkholderia eburnea]